MERKFENLLLTKFFINWQKSDNAPEDIYEPIVYCTKNNKMGVFKNTYTFLGGNEENKISDWKFLKEKYNVTFWIYQKDIIPHNFKYIEDFDKFRVALIYTEIDGIIKTWSKEKDKDKRDQLLKNLSFRIGTRYCDESWLHTNHNIHLNDGKFYM